LYQQFTGRVNRGSVRGWKEISRAVPFEVVRCVRIGYIISGSEYRVAIDTEAGLIMGKFTAELAILQQALR
jgi:hypothetical protein